MPDARRSGTLRRLGWWYMTLSLLPTEQEAQTGIFEGAQL